MRRGEVWFINLDPTIGAELKKTRPAVIVNDDAVGLLPLKVIVPLTAPLLMAGCVSLSRPTATAS